MTGMKSRSARRRRDDGEEPAEHDHLGDGPDPAHQRQRDRPRVLHPATRARQRRGSGGGTNIYRGHDNVQGATDIGPNPDSLPGYYGAVARLVEALGQRLGRRLEWLKKQFASQTMMEKPGITVSRWIDAVLEKNEASTRTRTCGRSSTGATRRTARTRQGNARGDEEARPSRRRRPVSVRDRGDGALVRKDDVYLLPAATQLECEGS